MHHGDMDEEVNVMCSFGTDELSHREACLCNATSGSGVKRNNLRNV